jgi:cupin superfamily acireductone dioxygenase involved in methionine salvage
MEDSLKILVDELKNILKKEGFTHVYDWHNEPGTEYPAHVHKGKVAMYIIHGGLTFRFTEKDHTGQNEVPLHFGARFDVPVGKEHTAKVGEDGCTYVVGEMIEGDS